MAPAVMPKLMPPIAKKPTKNKTLNKGNETRVLFEILERTPPNNFRLKSLFIFNYFLLIFYKIRSQNC